MLESLRAALAPVSLALTEPGFLRRGANQHTVRLIQHTTVRPARAAQTGKSFDAKFRFHNEAGGIRPLQNDHVSVDGINWWVVWRVLPSPLDTHSYLECKAQPTDIVIPVTRTRIPDSIGGSTYEDVPDASRAFPAALRMASAEGLLTAQEVGQMNRLMLGYWGNEVDLQPGNRLVVRSQTYTVMSVSTDDENPLWGRAVLARED